MRGKLAGLVANTASTHIDAELGNSIQMYISILEYIKAELSEISGISKQREGQISNRETVGGIERSNLQSSNITEWYYAMHDDTRRRVLECFLETAKIALRGQTKKFNYLLSTGELELVTIDGDEFAESDYGIVVDTSPDSANLTSKLESLAQAALQNQLLSFSTIMKIYTSSSLSEIQRLIEFDEKTKLDSAAAASQEQLKQNQEIAIATLESKQALEQAKMDLDNEMNLRDNETKLLIAQVQADADKDGLLQSEKINKENTLLKIQELSNKLAVDREKLANDRLKINSNTNK